MNNYQKHIEQINNLKNKPTLLLHVCCGVCSVYPLVYLKQFFNITIYFSNSNIYPYEEFAKRLSDKLNNGLEKQKSQETKKEKSKELHENSNLHFLTKIKMSKMWKNTCWWCYS